MYYRRKQGRSAFIDKIGDYTYNNTNFRQEVFYEKEH